MMSLRYTQWNWLLWGNNVLILNWIYSNFIYWNIICFESRNREFCFIWLIYGMSQLDKFHKWFCTWLTCFFFTKFCLKFSISYLQLFFYKLWSGMDLCWDLINRSLETNLLWFEYNLDLLEKNSIESPKGTTESSKSNFLTS